MTGPLRVAVVAALPQTAPPLVAAVRALGHEVPVVIGLRRPHDWPGHLLGERDLPPGVDLALPARADAVTGLLRAYAPDVAVSYGYPRRLPAAAVAAPRLGTVNCHPSDLPSYRGPNPVGWAVRNGEREIGVTWHRMDADLDTGRVLARTTIPLDDEIWSFTGVNTRVLDAASALLPGVLARLVAGDPGEEQPAREGSWAGFFDEDYAHVDWSAPAAHIHTQVRAWNIAGHHPRVRGPLALLDGTHWQLRRTTLHRPPPHTARRIPCGTGTLWLLSADPAD
ncbi:methionyl-tRNA formyltransferase [Streptomyces sp. VRA16 Mangrove soil]|uniref:methionyl-tRNA formyltransferase n=1 Tax=Streptomyces sp. VRA16 Mangrove soil TaxID=2817434 RepID=UPI001A9F7EEE|nr:formyltransferase family protein [Streptomyces sp. VRA16 Mangrove soil]MBO1333035.1 methionyl-tRNA formyltransferase [Streptomyces sp. VRA16 Mangrove soil]